MFRPCQSSRAFLVAAALVTFTCSTAAAQSAAPAFESPLPTDLSATSPTPNSGELAGLSDAEFANLVQDYSETASPEDMTCVMQSMSQSMLSSGVGDTVSNVACAGWCVAVAHAKLGYCVAWSGAAGSAACIQSYVTAMLNCGVTLTVEEIEAEKRRAARQPRR